MGRRRGAGGEVGGSVRPERKKEKGQGGRAKSKAQGAERGKERRTTAIKLKSFGSSPAKEAGGEVIMHPMVCGPRACESVQCAGRDEGFSFGKFVKKIVMEFLRKMCRRRSMIRSKLFNKHNICL